MAVQAVIARRLCGRKMQKIVEERSTSIRYDLRKGLSSTMGRGRPQLTGAAVNEEKSPGGDCVGAFNNAAQESCHDSRRQGFVRGKKLPMYSVTDILNRQQQGLTIDPYAFVHVLKWCFYPKDLIAVRQVHTCIIQSGMDKQPYVATALLIAYVRCGRLQDARRVFDGLEKKTVVIWRTMISGYAKNDHAEDALGVLNRMRQGGAQPDDFMCLSILKACASPLALKWGKEVHTNIRHAGLESDLRVGTALVEMYVKCGCITEARRAFEKLTGRNIITWTLMIGAYAKSGCGVEAYRLFVRMKREGIIPNAITYLCILNPSASAGALKWVKEVDANIRHAGLESDLRVGTALVEMYIKCGCITEARGVFEKLSDRNVVTWTMMIGAYAKSGFGVKAYRLFVRMKREGFIPNAITYLCILNPSASAVALEWVEEIHANIRHAGLESDLRVGTALVQMYAKCGCITEARRVFEKLTDRSVRTWNAMIGAYAKSGCGVEAYRLFVRMKREGFIPNAITVLCILNPSASAGALEWVDEVHANIRHAGLESDLRVGTALIQMYAKCGCITEARRVFENLTNRVVMTWNVMIGAYAESGSAVEAYRLFFRMRREGVVPNVFTYVSTLNASPSAGALGWVREIHSHVLKAGLESDSRVGNVLVHMYAKSGSVDDARLVFDRMEKRDVILWNTMIGAYAKSGCGVEADRLFLQMKREGFIPDSITCASILNAS